MKDVLIAIPCLLNGGTEWQTLRLVEALQSGGYQTLTVCYFEYDFEMVQRFQATGGRVVCLSAYGKRPNGAWKVYRFLREGFRRTLNDFHPDITHVQYMAPGAMPIGILRQLGVRNIIATSHTDADIYKSLKGIHFIQRHLLRAFTCVSQQAEEHFFGSSCLYEPGTPLHRHNHFTIPNCLPAEWKCCTRPKETAPNKFVVGVVSRLEYIKGVDTILPQFAKLLKQRPKCRLLIVGTGKLKDEMVRQQQQLGIASDRITWVGQVVHQRLDQYYQQIDVLWIPSRSEGFGLTAIEAHSHAIPVVATPTGGLIDTVHNGKDGILTQSENFAESTIQMLEDNEQFHAMQQEALANASAYTFDRYKTRVLDLYKCLTLNQISET